MSRRDSNYWLAGDAEPLIECDMWPEIKIEDLGDLDEVAKKMGLRHSGMRDQVGGSLVGWLIETLPDEVAEAQKQTSCD